MRFKLLHYIIPDIGYGPALGMFIMLASLLGPSQWAQAGTIAINFDSLPTGPDNFAAAGAMQTLSQAGVYSITGGVVLGNPTFLPAFAANGTVPNLYGTTDIADPTLLPTLTLTLPAAESVTTVAGVLFNGMAIEDYTVTAFSGVTQLGSITILQMASNLDSGFANFSVISNPANPITQLTITTPNAQTNGWGFLVDSITLTTTSITNPVPSPGVLPLLITGLITMAGLRRRSKLGV